MGKEFLVGVANVYGYNKKTGGLLFHSKSMSNSTLEITTSSTDVNGGQGNALQFIYFNTSDLNVSLEDTQFNFNMISANIGSELVTGGNIWEDETVELGAGGVGTVLGTPTVTPDVEGSVIYGTVFDSKGDPTQVTFTGKDFVYPGGEAGEKVCVRFYSPSASAKVISLPSNIVPSTVRLVMDCQLASSETASASGGSVIGKVQFEIDSAILDGAQSIQMSSDGVATTPLSARALSSEGSGGCSSGGVYGKITKIEYSANWYDDVTSLAIANAIVDLSTGETETLDVRAIPNVGQAFKVSDYSDLTFATTDAGVATVDTAGIVSFVGVGTANITVGITSKPSVESVVALVTAT